LGGAYTLVGPRGLTYGCHMELVEIKQKERVGREEVAARLRQIADQLARHNDLEFERDGISFKIRVPDEVQLKVEFEVEDDESELEIELTW
jgi:amphi-Trp domain-containing protein